MSTTVHRFSPAKLRQMPQLREYLSRAKVPPTEWRILGRPTTLVIEFYLQEQDCWIEVPLKKSAARRFMAMLETELARWDRN